MAILGSIDLGTNTFRLLIAKIHTASSFETRHAENNIVRLGEGFAEEKRILPAALQRGLSALHAFRETIDTIKVEQVAVTGTSALREAKNRDLFLEAVKAECGFEVTVLSGEEEARLTLLGVGLLFKTHAEPMLVCDIGGGSTELIGQDRTHRNFVYSLPLGAVALHEKYLLSDPPKPNELAALKAAVDLQLEKTVADFQRPDRFVGTAGTITSLAAIDLEMARYDPERINGHVLSAAKINALMNKLGRIPAKARAKIPGLERGREDIILSGGLILNAILDRFGYDRLTVSDYGLREGVLIDLFRKRGDRI